MAVGRTSQLRTSGCEGQWEGGETPFCAPLEEGRGRDGGATGSSSHAGQKNSPVLLLGAKDDVLMEMYVHIAHALCRLSVGRFL